MRGNFDLMSTGSWYSQTPYTTLRRLYGYPTQPFHNTDEPKGLFSFPGNFSPSQKKKMETIPPWGPKNPRGGPKGGALFFSLREVMGPWFRGGGGGLFFEWQDQMRQAGCVKTTRKLC